jgi:DNA-binding transcriptional ArsR family regulator
MMSPEKDANLTSGIDDATSRAIIRMQNNIVHASALLKSMAHEGRLFILCLLYIRERSVMELEQSLDLRQPAVSQQLARLRSDNLVSTRRDGKMIYYSLASEEARAMVCALASQFGR